MTQPKVELPDAKYGENKAYEAAQDIVRPDSPEAAPPAPDATQAAPSAETTPLPQIGSFGRPSERPDEPVTAGSPLGAGPNSLPSGPFTQQQSQMSYLAEWAAGDPSGYIADLAHLIARGQFLG